MKRFINMRWLAVAAMALTVTAVACASGDDPTATPTSTSAPPTNTPQPSATAESSATAQPSVTATPGSSEQVNFELVSGWYRDEQVEYYDFGSNTPVTDGAVSTAPIYVFITGMDENGDPMFVEGQHNIVDVVPGDEGYSDLWQVNLVTVPEDYEVDSITSYEELMAVDFEITPTSMFVNCPIVPEGSTLESGQELVQGWYNGEEVFYPDFGLNPATAIPIWAFITGFDGGGAPQFVEGQQNIIDSVPGDDGYSAFWEVNLVMVPEDYEANSVTSRAEVEAMDWEVVKPGIVVNCPVIEYPGA